MEQIIDNESRKFLEERFQELSNEVVVNVYFRTGENENEEYVNFTKQFFKELGEINSKIKVNFRENVQVSDAGIPIETNPTVTIGEDKGYKIIFRGSPLGYEASQIVETLIMVSNNSHDIEGNMAKELSSISKPVNIKVFVTPSCPYCPASAYLANRIAVASSGKVTSEVIEANEVPDLAMKWGIESVPTQIINDSEDSITIGVQDEHSFINQVLSFAK
ncbi:MAG: thioredoxin family protein [Brevinematia bacterium]